MKTHRMFDGKRYEMYGANYRHERQLDNIKKAMKKDGWLVRITHPGIEIGTSVLWLRKK